LPLAGERVGSGAFSMDEAIAQLRAYWGELAEAASSPAFLRQAAAAAAAVLASLGLAWGARSLLRSLAAGLSRRSDWLGRGFEAAAMFSGRGLLAILLWVGVGYLRGQEQPYAFANAVASLATLWIVIGLLSRALGDRVYFRLLALVLGAILSLNAIGLLEAVGRGLDSLAVTLGDTRLSALSVFKGLLVALLVIPLGSWLSKLTERSLGRVDGLTPSFQALFLKLFKIAVGVVVFFVAIGAMGVNMAALTIFGGAVGLGLGFGFQKVVSNLVSGVILLMDRSIKPGDVIEVDETYGWINTLSARYVSVITRDGTEHLIPNEKLISEKVINWSFSDDKVRIKAGFGVSYGSDVDQVIAIALDVMKTCPRVLENPEPRCFLVEFGDSSLNMELRYWIRDPFNGVTNIKNELFLKLWRRFREEGVEIPFPQRDVHIRSGAAE